MRTENQKNQAVVNLEKTVAELTARLAALESRPAKKTASSGRAETLDSVTLAFLREKPAKPEEIVDRIYAEKPYVLRAGSTRATLLTTTVRRLTEQKGVKNLGVEVRADSDGRYYDLAAWEAEQKTEQAKSDERIAAQRAVITE
jgi:hypothetical protein